MLALPPVIVANKRTFRPVANDVTFYVGRPSPLGNPFKITQTEPAPMTRAEAVDAFRRYFVTAADQPKIHRLLNRMLKECRAGRRVVLLCYCAPMACHAHVIKAWLENELSP